MKTIFVLAGAAALGFAALSASTAPASAASCYYKLYQDGVGVVTGKLAITGDGPEILLGDIVLARETCAAEARDKGIGFADHAAHLLVHGTLHLLGYDHQDDGSAGDMEQREVRALTRLGIANPYEAKV